MVRAAATAVPAARDRGRKPDAMILHMSSHRATAYPARAAGLALRRPARGDRVLVPGDLGYYMGRYAFYQGLRSLLAAGSPRRRVLLPALHCSVLVEACLAAGLTSEFYPVSLTGAPDLAALRSQAGPDVLAVVVVHLYGWPADVAAVKAAVSHSGAAIVEDCAHALFSRAGGAYVGSSGDVSIFSLRKSLPVPDGGVLRLNRAGLSAVPPVLVRAALRRGAGTTARLLGGGAVIRVVRRLARSRATAGRDGAPPGGELSGFAPALVRASMSPLTRQVAARVVPSDIVQRRRAAYTGLHHLLEDHPRFRPLFEGLPEGVCPLSLVILHPRRDQVETALLDRGVEVWSFGRGHHSSFDPSRFPETRQLCDESLALPVHQEMDPNDLEHLADLVRESL